MSLFDGDVHPGCSLTEANIYQSLSEENLVKGMEDGEGEEVKVVRSEGEESEEEGKAEKRLQEMQALVRQRSHSPSGTPLRPDSLAGNIYLLVMLMITLTTP